MNELLHIVWRDKKDIVLALVCGVIAGLTAVALFAQSGYLISKAALMPPFYIILILTAFLKVFGVVKSASKYTERYISHRVTFRILSDIRLRYFDSLAHISGSLFERYQSGELLTTITNDVTRLQNFFLRVVYPPLVALLVFLCTILFTAFFSVWIALVLFVGFLLVAVIIPSIFIVKKQMTSSDSTPVKQELTQFLYGFRELKQYHLVDSRADDIFSLSEVYADDVEKKQHALNMIQLVSQAASYLTIFVIVVLSAYFASVGALDSLYLAMQILIALTVFETVIPLAQVPQFYKEAAHSMVRLQAIDAKTSERTITLGHMKPYEIEAKQVSLHYDGAMKPALRDVSFTIAPGEKVAIVGPSGSGKTTLLQLMLDSFPPTTGTLSIHQVPYQKLIPDCLWQLMAVQLQHNHFFSGTIRDNLRIADETLDEAALEDALTRAQLPVSLDDEVLEQGANLSGGEKQRLAFARVLLKPSAIWLLDEPFTSLDAETEQMLFSEMLRETKYKSLVLITHKLRGLEHFDRIFVMQDGVLVESGTYEELMKQRGLFFEMKRLVV